MKRTAECWEMGMNDVEIVEDLKHHYDPTLYSLGYAISLHIAITCLTYVVTECKRSENGERLGDSPVLALNHRQTKKSSIFFPK